MAGLKDSLGFVNSIRNVGIVIGPRRGLREIGFDGGMRAREEAPEALL
jgi:hypothetical protein